MTRWQRRMRFVILVAGVMFGLVVAWRIRSGPPERTVAPLVRRDAKAIIETAEPHFTQTNREREEVDIRAGQHFGYDDGTGKLVGNVRVVTLRARGRTFTITSAEALINKDATAFTFKGGVELTSSDGMVVRTGEAVYTDADGMLRADGPVTFSQNRISGSGVGVTYDKNQDLLKILNQAETEMAPEEGKADRLEVMSGSAEFDRPKRTIVFERDLTITRDFETMEAETATAHLSDDEQRLEKLELRENAQVTGTRPGAGALKRVNGREIDLKYGDDGRSLRDAAVRGSAVIEVSGEGGQAGSQIGANTIDLSLGGDGSVLTSLSAREAVQLTIPSSAGEPARTITSDAMDARGEEPKGLTGARFTGRVELRERGKDLSRTASAPVLDVKTAAGLGALEDANFSQGAGFKTDTVSVTSTTAQYAVKDEAIDFSQNVQFKSDKASATADSARYELKQETLELSQGVKFETGSMTGRAASAVYRLKTEKLELRGSDRTARVPRMSNDRISINGQRIDVSIDGPVVTASGSVTSSLQPAKTEPGGRGAAPTETKVPSMLKDDLPVDVTASALTYDGAASRATYTGNVILSQKETRIKGAKVIIDDKTGNLTASGDVETRLVMVQTGKDGKKSRATSTGTAKEFHYDDSLRRARYSGNARLLEAQGGDLRAKTIELYLKASGEELDRAEAYEDVILVESGRKTTGDELKYFSASPGPPPTEDRYEMKGKPGRQEDACKRESTFLTLKFFRGNTRIIASGPAETRSDGSACP